MLCDNLEGRDGVGNGKKVQEVGNICMPMTDSCCCMAEINLQYCIVIILQLKIKNKKFSKSKKNIKINKCRCSQTQFKVIMA